MKKISRLNPYYFVVVIFVASLIFYLFDWSTLYPHFSLGMVIFFIVFLSVMWIVGHFSLPFFSRIILKARMSGIRYSRTLILFILIFILFGSLGDGMYSKGFPIIRHIDDYGIPMLHVITITLAMFLSAYSMQLFCYTSKKIHLVIMFVSFIPNILGLSREGIILSSISVIIIYLLNKFNSIKPKVLVIVTLGGVLGAFIFGLAGNYRTNNQVGLKTTDIFDSSLIYQMGSANSDIPSVSKLSPFFWSYLYLTSPIANLQAAVNNNVEMDPEGNSVQEFISTQFEPDVISSRMYPDYKNKVVMYGYSSRVSESLNVATTFYESYLQQGWLGMIIMASFFVIFPLLYLYFIYLINPGFVIIGMSILDVMYTMSVFDNPWAFSGISIQLILTLLLALTLRKNKIN